MQSQTTSLPKTQKGSAMHTTQEENREKEEEFFSLIRALTAKAEEVRRKIEEEE